MEYQAKKACRQELKSEKLRAKPLQLRPLGISIVIYLLIIKWYNQHIHFHAIH